MGCKGGQNHPTVETNMWCPKKMAKCEQCPFLWGMWAHVTITKNGVTVFNFVHYDRQEVAEMVEGSKSGYSIQLGKVYIYHPLRYNWVKIC